MTLSERIADAEKALHELVTGQQARVFVDQNGERVEYTPANRSALQAYINDLKNQLPNACRRGRALKVYL